MHPRLALFAPLLVLLAGCSPSSPVRTEAVEASLARARSRVAGHSAERHEIDAAWQRARTAAAYDAARSSWWPWSAPRALEHWQEATRIAYAAVLRVEARETETTARWNASHQDALGLLADARRAIARLSHRRLAGELRLAEAALGRAERWATRGDLARANDEADRSRDHSLTILDGSDRLKTRFGDPSLRRQWARWIQETLQVSRQTGSPAIVVDKLHRKLHLYEAGREVATFPVELGSRGLERKLYAGDRATPEGRYRVTERRDRGQTRFYKALMLDYPNAEDQRRFGEAIRRGEISSRSRIGGLIEIHGDGGRELDWTEGCVAMTNRDIDRLFDRVPLGAPVTIVGTRP